MTNMKVNLAGIKMKNPIATASGTFGFGFEYESAVKPEMLGAVVVKGITLEPRSGNPGVRLKETPAGLLNSIGLQNPGVDYFLKEILPKLVKREVTTIVNISGNNVEEYSRLAEKLTLKSGVSGLEVNVSCPNVKEGGLAFGVDPEHTYQAVKGVVKNSNVPVIVKLTPNVTDIVAIAKAAQEGGADGLALINTVTGMAIDVYTKKPVLGNIIGGLSGPAIKPVAVKAIWQVSQAVSLPIMGMGGVVTWEDAAELMLAGATSVAVGTGNFINPKATLEIIDGLRQYCENQGYTDINELIGLGWREN